MLCKVNTIFLSKLYIIFNAEGLRDSCVGHQVIRPLIDARLNVPDHSML